MRKRQAKRRGPRRRRSEHRPSAISDCKTLRQDDVGACGVARPGGLPCLSELDHLVRRREGGSAAISLVPDAAECESCEAGPCASGEGTGSAVVLSAGVAREQLGAHEWGDLRMFHPGSMAERLETRRLLVHLVPAVRAAAGQDGAREQVQGTAAQSRSAPCVWRDSCGRRRALFVPALSCIAEAEWLTSEVLCCDAEACDRVRPVVVTPAARSPPAGVL